MYTIEIYRLDVVNSQFLRVDVIQNPVNLSFHSVLNGIGGCSFDMDVYDQKTIVSNLYRFRNQIIVKDNNTIVWFGPIVKVSGGFSDVKGVVKIEALSYLAHFNARFTSGIFVNDDAGTIASTIITDTQALTNGSLKVSNGTIATTINRDRTYYNKPISDAISDLANVENGFDFAFTPVYDSFNKLASIQFNVYTALGVIRDDLPKLRLGENVEDVSFATQNEIVNTVTALGAGSGSGVLTGTATNGSSQQAFTRREGIVKFSDVFVQSTIDQKAAEVLNLDQSDRYDLNITLMPETAPRFGDFILGDLLPIDIVVEGTIINFTGYARVIELAIDVDQNGVGKITPKIQYIS